jgi:hypothetical protein
MQLRDRQGCGVRWNAAAILRVPLPMDENRTSLERAFEIAKSGSCGSMEELKRVLRSEGYSSDQVVGRSLTAQLRVLMTNARKPQ